MSTRRFVVSCALGSHQAVSRFVSELRKHVFDVRIDRDAVPPGALRGCFVSIVLLQAQSNVAHLEYSSANFIYALIALNYIFLLLASLAALLLTASFTRRQRARFPVLRKLDGRKLILTAIAALLFLLSYAAYALKEVAVVRSSFRVTPGPGVSQSVAATATGLDLELIASATQRANAARASFNNGQVHFALRQYREAADYYRQSGEALPTLAATLNRGVSLRYIPDYPAAEAVLRAGLQLASAQHQEPYTAHFSLYLSSVLINRDSYDEAELLVRKACKIYEALGDDFGQANAHLNSGNIFAAREADSQAVDQLRMALDGFSRSGSALGKANVHNNIGVRYLTGLRLAEAATEFHAALALYRAIENRTGTARASTNLAQVYVLQGRLAEALALSRDALNQAVRQGDPQQRSAALSMIGTILDEQGNFADAVAVELEALQLARDVGSPDDEASAHYLLASSYRQLEQVPESRDHAAKVIALNGRGVNPSLVAAAWNEVGLGYLSQNRIEKATNAFSKALTVPGANAPAVQAFTWVSLGKLEAERGQTERAIMFLGKARGVYFKAKVKSGIALEAEQLFWRLKRSEPGR